ncbi:MAG: hypothetical protein JNM42_10535 [Propionivibrio sp.]|uniref:hypothetical protein n=1 Tax=Propionivibrio sp. TaxID=2212460 RepID=UPI001A4A54DC|nr:hypothetical protein [Propionivibrio sp.]MBL8414862.1 hypothetical protein [Propionivibrio sp.]
MTTSTSHVPGAPLPADCRDAAAVLNRGCVCRSVDHEKLSQALAGGVVGEGGQAKDSLGELLATRPHLFSDTRVYVAEAHLQFMADLIGVIEQVVGIDAWNERVLDYAPEIARHSPAAAGVFLGYDFHLGADGPRLIEINTNAGGGLLNAKLLRAQNACCTPMLAMPDPALEDVFVSMFREEWRLARGEAQLRCIAIVDAAPAGQFLAPEFELFRQLFESRGILALVVAPGDLSFDGERVLSGGRVVDLVYNRLTDFSLAETQHEVLRASYHADAVVLTPHPQAHARYADKRNLEALTDEAWLKEIGVSAAHRQLLMTGIPRTERVEPEQAARFWASRKQWFFKPAAGYGSKGTYRGDKLTRRVFAEISRGGYVAQALVPPSERRLLVDGVEQDLKLDLRNYVYQGKVQLVSARLYQGQTTNFRTPGGGFAAVFSVSCQGDEKVCNERERL